MVKYRSSVFVMLLLGILVLGAFYPKIDEQRREQVILDAVVRFIDEAHFDPQTVDDAFSEQAFKNYLNYIDPAKRFLTMQDVAKLKVHEKTLDDQVKARSFEYFDESLVLLEAGISKAEGIYNKVIKGDFDFSIEESLELDADKRDFASNDDELEDNWRKFIKYEILTRLDRKIEESKNDGKKEGLLESAKESAESLKKISEPAEEGEEVKSFEDLKKEAIEETKETFDDWFVRMSKVRRSDRFETFLNSMTHIQDPHSDYFSPRDKEAFDIRMGGKLEGIGARLQTDDEYTKVVSIVAGGPAWMGKELEVNDVIVQVTQKGEDPVDITGMRIDDVVSMIRGKKGTVVVLTVKKAEGGELQDIEIERDVVQLEEVFAKSVILDVPGEVKNIGYIKLPKFYSSFEQEDGNSSAVDVAKEIEKLNDEGVNGIILDLRNNGGGSLPDVIDMSGLFIESGPIVQVKSRGRTPRVYKDKDPKAHYDGPLVVMVNSVSASASEILAAALQDYKRAVIVGSGATFGKGTVQRFVDLDRAIRGNEDIKPLGQVKLTIQKYYRIDGGSTQLKGVTPDIILPDNYAVIDYGEREYDNAMEWTQIDPVTFEQGVYTVSNYKELAEKSKSRVLANERFEMVRSNAERIKKNRDVTSYPLSIEGYQTMMDTREKESEAFDDLYDEDLGTIQPRNLNADLEKINLDEKSIEKNKDWLSNLKKDFYLEEALRIIKDVKSE